MFNFLLFLMQSLNFLLQLSEEKEHNLEIKNQFFFFLFLDVLK